MATKRLSEKATFVQRGWGQVEPNHLAARRTGQIYAQLPADPSIDVLENGQFAIYDYAHKVVTTGKATINLAEEGDDGTSKGEYMLVLNEVKLYKDREQYEDFALKKDDYYHSLYSPIGQSSSTLQTILNFAGQANVEGDRNTPFSIQVPGFDQSPVMPEGTTMVPRLLRTYVGDIMTTNTIAAEPGSLKVGDILVVGEGGYLTTGTPAAGDIAWQVSLVYTLADNQPAVKIVRIA